MNLTTRYLGMTLNSPFVHAASPLAKDLDNVRRMEDAGAGAVVLYSLFEEQIDQEKQALDRFLTAGTESFAEALSYFPEPEEFMNLHAEEYLEHIRKAKEAVEIPIIASLNGVSKGGWIDYAKRIEEAGADALELNIYYVPTDLGLSGAKVEDIYVEDLQTVKSAVSIPVAIKVGPFFSSFANLAKRLDDAGTDGIVLFNRFFAPEIDVENLEIVPKLILSTPSELSLVLRWVAVLYGHLSADLAATSGVHTGLDAAKAIMAGATAVQVASCLYCRGVDYFSTLSDELGRWMEKHEYESVAQLKGCMSYHAVAEPAAYERANYMKTLQSYK